MSELHREPAGEQFTGRPERQRCRLDHDQVIGVDDAREVDGEVRRVAQWQGTESAGSASSRIEKLSAASSRMVEPVEIVEDDDERLRSTASAASTSLNADATESGSTTAPIAGPAIAPRMSRCEASTPLRGAAGRDPATRWQFQTSRYPIRPPSPTIRSRWHRGGSQGHESPRRGRSCRCRGRPEPSSTVRRPPMSAMKRTLECVPLRPSPDKFHSTSIVGAAQPAVIGEIRAANRGRCAATCQNPER